MVQKRSTTKKKYPNKWDIPSAGHIDAGEDLLTGCVRETFEELGINLPKSALEFQLEMVNEKGWELSQQYLVFNNTKTEDMKLDPEEVAEVKWLTPTEFEKLLYSDDFVPHRKEYKETVLEFIKNAIKER